MRLKCGLVAALVMTGACDVLGTTETGAGTTETGADQTGADFKLTVTERSATTLSLNWTPMPQSVGNAYVVDYFGGLTTCVRPQPHNDVLRVTGSSVQLTGLTPSTSYQIHVHPLPFPNPQGTNTVLVSTLATGAPPAPVAAADYNPCKN